jgi:hypothetical protein
MEPVHSMNLEVYFLRDGKALEILTEMCCGLPVIPFTVMWKIPIVGKT